jgi:site-specific DNA-methyltransferase (adenine-specific)
VVLDPFCGSGTTLVAAARLGRPFAGGDVGELAIETTSRRLVAEGAAFALKV